MSEIDKKAQYIEYTKCPKCGTLFDVSDINFSDSKGWVQCGDCTEQFDAAKNSVNYSALLEQSILANMGGMNTVQGNFTVGGLNVDSTHEVEETLSEEVDVLGGAIAVDQTKKAASSSDSADFVLTKSDFAGKLSIDDEPSLEVVDQETSFESEDYTLVKSRLGKGEKSAAVKDDYDEYTVDLQKQVNDHDIDIEPDLYRELSGGSRSTFGSTLLYLLAIPLVLALGLVLLLQLQNRGLINVIPDNIVSKIENTVPFLAKSNDSSGEIDLSEIDLSSTRMERHPTRPGHVNIILQLTNKNSIQQAYPALEVSFTDKVGETIARRSFKPEQFLSPNSSGILKSLESKTLTLTFAKLPEGSAGYEVQVTKP